MKPMPIYIYTLFCIVSAILLYLIISWATTSTNYREGLTAKDKYKYTPSKTSPNVSLEFTVDDLATDLSNACVFIKLDSQLTKPTPAPTITPTTTPEPTGAAATTAAMTPAPYSNETEPANTTTPANTKEPTTATTPANTEEPTTPAKLENKESFTDSADTDYTTSYTQLPIYKTFITETGYNKSSNDTIYKKMDEIYGMLFDSAKIGELTDSNIDALWNKNSSIVIDDAIYNGIYSFALSKKRECAYANNETNGLSSYFLRQVKQNKSKRSVLLSLKNAYYAIVKPRFLMNGLSNVYWKNAVSFTNSDKGTFNSILLVLNGFAEMASTNKLTDDLSASEVADIRKDTTFTNDSLRIYQLVSIGFELYRFVSYFEKNRLKDTPSITTTFTTFISGYPQYLKKVNQVAAESPLVFLMRNAPNNDECPVLDKLRPFLSSIDS